MASDQDSILEKAAAAAANPNLASNRQGEDIMSVLLAHEKKGGVSATAVKSLQQDSSESSDNEDAADMQAVDTGKFFFSFIPSLKNNYLDIIIYRFYAQISLIQFNSFRRS